MLALVALVLAALYMGQAGGQVPPEVAYAIAGLAAAVLVAAAVAALAPPLTGAARELTLELIDALTGRAAWTCPARFM